MNKKVLLVALLIFNSLSASAGLAPINVQQAKINLEDGKKNQLSINFDWFHDHANAAGLVDLSTSSLSLPRLDWRRSLDTKIPSRIGLSTALMYGDLDANVLGFGLNSSAFGFGNLGLTLEAGVIQKDNVAVTLYVNQHIPLLHNGLLVSNTLRPVSGRNAYGFQTGAEYTIKLSDHLAWHGDVGYRFDVPDTGEVQQSLVYYNEAVLSTDHFGLSLGLLGNSVYNDDIGTDLRIVPGVIVPFENWQFRASLPLGLNIDSPDIGVQASLLTSF